MVHGEGDTNTHAGSDGEAPSDRVHPDVIAASLEVDETLIAWLRELSPLERVEWTLRTARSIERARRVS